MRDTSETASCWLHLDLARVGYHLRLLPNRKYVFVCRQNIGRDGLLFGSGLCPVPAVSTPIGDGRAATRGHDDDDDDDADEDGGFAESWRFACAACGEFGQSSDRLINGDRDLLGPWFLCSLVVY